MASRYVQFVVVVPSLYPAQFVGIRKMVSEYPEAAKLATLRTAQAIAKKHPGGQVWTVDGFESGAGPVWVNQ